MDEKDKKYIEILESCGNDTKIPELREALLRGAECIKMIGILKPSEE